MPDFLASLVNRALGREAVLQPRRPSLYEPAGARGLEAAPAETRASGVEPVNVPRAEPPTDPPTGPLRAAPIPGNEVSPARTTASVEPPRPFTDSAPSPTPPQPAGIETIVVERAELTVTRDGYDLAAAHAPRVTHRDPTRAVELARVEVPSPHGVPVQRTDAWRPEPARHDADVKPFPMPARTALSEQRPPERREISAWPPSAEPAKSEPVIHVTIGRVEVKATSTPPSVERGNRSKGPRLSLEDYLRSRGGGTR